MQQASVRGSASVSVDARLFGPPRTAEVLAVLPTAVYLRLPDEGPVPAVLPVLTADAVRLPGSVLLPASSRSRPLTRLVGPAAERATVGLGAVRVGALHVRVTQRWQQRPAPPGRPSTLAGWWSARQTGAGRLRSTPAGGVVADRAADLADAVACGELSAALAAADRLHGLGPGLTPAGDDVLAALLLTLRRFPALDRGALADPLGRRLAAAAARTTPLSAALLARADRAEAAPQLLDLVDALATGQPVALPLRRLLSVGHTSGAALAVGAGLAGAMLPFVNAVHAVRPMEVR